MLIDRRRHSSIPDVRSFRATDCDTEQKIRERLIVNKQGLHKFHMERFSLKKLNEVEGKEKFYVDVLNMYSALEDLDTEVEINTVWEAIRENIKF
jgi:hypothetical protein